MKTLISIAIFLISLNINAQIALLHSFDSASTYFGHQSQLMIIRFEESGDKYVRINKEGKTIDIYNLNQTLSKSISYASFPQNTNNTATILYFSDKLFNTDSKIEFMYLYFQDNPIIANTRIYNEDGELILKADSMFPLVVINVLQQQCPIYNTTEGTRMILSNQFTGQAKVYGLPGTLTTAIAEANSQLIQAQEGQFKNLYPNPSNGKVTLQYQLPKGEQMGEIVLYNLQGAEVKRYKVDNTFNDILIDNSQLQAGTYFYQLQTGKGAVGIKKMVIIK